MNDEWSDFKNGNRECDRRLMLKIQAPGTETP